MATNYNRRRKKSRRQKSSAKIKNKNTQKIYHCFVETDKTLFWAVLNTKEAFIKFYKNKSTEVLYDAINILSFRKVEKCTEGIVFVRQNKNISNGNDLTYYFMSNNDRNCWYNHIKNIIYNQNNVTNKKSDITK
eukprot:21618_1